MEAPLRRCFVGCTGSVTDRWRYDRYNIGSKSKKGNIKNKESDFDSRQKENN